MNLTMKHLFARIDEIIEINGKKKNPVLNINIDLLSNVIKFNAFYVPGLPYIYDEKNISRLTKINNQYYKRTFKYYSRPCIADIADNKDLKTDLREFFFNARGQVLQSVLQDGPKYSYIGLDSNKNDKRFWIRFKDSTDNNSVCIMLQNILSQHGLINIDKESIFDVSLLIGGTHEQDWHFDNPRLFASAIYKDDSKYIDPNDENNYYICHEVNRDLYNDDAKDKFAPASYLLDVTSRERGVKLGVPTYFLLNDGAKSGIKYGKPGDSFRIVNRREHKSVIHTIGSGLVFVGDFPHFGARNIGLRETKMNLTMKQLFARIDEIIEINGKKKNPDPLLFPNLFENFDNVNELTRLFFKTKPKTSKFQIYYLDSIGKVEKEVIESKKYDYPEWRK
jgi:hypothetical protein